MFELIIPFIPTIPYPDEGLDKYKDFELFKKDEQEFYTARKLEAEIVAENFLKCFWKSLFYISEVNFGEEDGYGLDDAMRIIFSNERI